MPRQGAKRKKTRTHKTEEEEEETPKSFIIHRKNIKQGVRELLVNFREVMYPYTAMKLQMKEKVKLSDYIKACKVYQMSHLMVFTSTDKHNYMKIVQAPSGPTLTFKILNYCTMQDIIDSQNKVKSFPRTFSTPILITNGFQEVEGQYKIVQQVMQNAFPALNVAKQQVGQIRRSIFMDFNSQKDVVYLRHYHIQSTPNNINKNLKKVIKSNKVPDLSKYDDVSEYFLRNNNLISDSEGEDLPDNTFMQTKKSQISQNHLNYQQAIRLHEVGPRMALRLIKIQEGVMTGKIIYHKFIKKTAEEILSQTNKIQQKITEKQKRKDQMQKIIQQKEQEKLDKKDKKKQKAMERQQSQQDQEEEEEQVDYDDDDQQIQDQDQYQQSDDDDDEDDELDQDDDDDELDQDE